MLILFISFTLFYFFLLIFCHSDAGGITLLFFYFFPFFLSFLSRRNHIIFSYFVLLFFSVLAPFPLGRVGVGTILFPLFPMLYPMLPIYCKLPAFHFLQWNLIQFLLPLDSAIYDFYSKKYVS